MERQGGRMSFARAVVFAALLAVSGGTSLSAAGGPTVAEKMLPTDSVLAIFVPDANATSGRWRTTALYEVLQTPEMQEMLAPLKESLSKLTSSGLPPELAQTQWSALFTGEAAVAAVLLPPAGSGAGPELMIQAVLRPEDAAKGKAAMEALIGWLVQSKAATRTVQPDNAQLLTFGKQVAVLYSMNDGAFVLTLNEKVIPAFLKLHSDTVARRNGAPGLSSDPEYALARGKLGPAPEAWLYLGVFPWIEKNAAIPPVSLAKPILAALGLQNVRGCVAGTTIEDRGFRTRMFVHMTPAGPAAAPQLIGPQQLALIPRDVVAFGIGSADWQGFYDRAMGVLSMLPGSGAEITQGMSRVETTLGMSIRNDLLGMLSGPYVSYATAPSSAIGQGQNFFFQVRDRNGAIQKLTNILNAASGLIQNLAAPDGDAFVRVRTIDRPHMTQVYAQSVLPGGFTPNFVISDTGWLSLDFSARSAVTKMEYFLDHKENITARPDFARILAKVPQGYCSISYTDVGRCFGNGLAGLQFLSDLAVAGVKIAGRGKELKLPMPLNQFWGMDQGRFPSEALLREKLFGSVSVTVRDADGMLSENFSPIGPIPLSTGQAGLTDSVATTSILAGMLLPALARAREEARRAACDSNLAQIMKGIITYQEKHNDNIPASLADLVPDYIDSPKVLVCPSDGGPMTIKNGIKCSYRYIGNIPWRDIGPGQFVAYDHVAHGERRNEGRNVAYFDGHVNFCQEEDFEKVLAEQYEQFKPLMAKPDFPGDRDRVKAFFENRDFPEK